MRARTRQDIQRIVGSITSVHTEPLALDAPFTQRIDHLARQSGTVVLLSGGDLDCARYHIVGAMPWLTFKCRGRELNITVNEESHGFQGHPLDILRHILETLRLDPASNPGPICAGLMGYLAYDLKDQLETLPRTSMDDLALPHICLYAPSVLIVHDKAEKKTHLHIPVRSTDTEVQVTRKSEMVQRLLAAGDDEGDGQSIETGPLRSNFTRNAYMAAVEKIRDYIASGHVYQVNLSQRLEAPFSGDSYHLFQKLYEANPAPFFAHINNGDHQIVSTSPERFILRNGSRVESRPIKGTRPRGRTPQEDDAMRQALVESRKDDAELSMIVDLMRNDMGKVCEGGSVRVGAHRRMEAYENVWHSVSTVEGVLAHDHDTVDLIAATFPGGSITGCPKIRAMEIIDELEPHRRHIYTGSIGYIGFHDTMDLSIAIRTATIAHGRIHFSVGGGVVMDSDPADEYDETLHKGRSLMKMFENSGTAQTPDQYAWVNGTLKSMDDAVVPIADQGLLYGYGFFETILADNGRCPLLDLHLKRFNDTWRALFGTTPTDLTWHDIIRQVIKANQLGDTTATVKMLATMGPLSGPPGRHTLIVTARPYTHRLVQKQKTGLDIGIYPYPRQNPLAAHKTLNYLYYLQAGKWAGEQGFDEAVILNADGTVSETNTANIVLIKEKKAIKPRSPYVLPGVMQQAVLGALSRMGYDISETTVHSRTFHEVDQVLLTNALMGVVGVLSVDGRTVCGGCVDLDEINLRVTG